MLTINGILSKLPHRYPFLLVDRVISCDPGQSIVSIKNVTINEPFFVGHFPDNPIMPGVMIIEAMAQTAGLLLSASLECESEKDSTYYLAGVDGARFRSPVTPGDTMEIKVTMLMNRTSISKYAARVYCSGRLMAEADLLCARV